MLDLSLPRIQRDLARGRLEYSTLFELSLQDMAFYPLRRERYRAFVRWDNAEAELLGACRIQGQDYDAAHAATFRMQWALIDAVRAIGREALALRLDDSQAVAA